MNLQQFRKELIQNGGSTYNFNSHKPTPKKGYQVGMKGHEQTFKFADIINIKSFVMANIELLLEDSYYLGGWFNDLDKLFYLDVSKHFDFKTEAIQFGKANDQLAIYDLENNKEIRL